MTGDLWSDDDDEGRDDEDAPLEERDEPRGMTIGEYIRQLDEERRRRRERIRVVL